MGCRNIQPYRAGERIESAHIKIICVVSRGKRLHQRVGMRDCLLMTSCRLK